jgi:hypothetical protein
MAAAGGSSPPQLLLQLLAHDDVRESLLSPRLWGVAGLWRLRGVCAALRGWATARLAACDRVVAVGGAVMCRTLAAGKFHRGTDSVESLDLATLRWSRGCGGCTPVLPAPRYQHGACSHANGTVVVVGGFDKHAPPHNQNVHLQRTALRWVPGSRAWARLPDLPTGCTARGAQVEALPDGRMLVVGGWASERREALSTVLALAADGRAWEELPPLRTARHSFASAVLPGGRVLVAGGLTGNRSASAIASVELWDPAVGAWAALPPMQRARGWPAACVLPSGRVAIVGSKAHGDRTRGEVYDPRRGVWEPLPSTKHLRGHSGLVAVAGGMIVIGSFQKHGAQNELFDEAGSGRWMTLPHNMVDDRVSTEAVAVRSDAIAAMWGPRPRVPQP